MCKGYQCDKVSTGNCTCKNVREKLKQKAKERPTLSAEEIKKRCHRCKAFPCDEFEYADANCSCVSSEDPLINYSTVICSRSVKLGRDF